MVTVKLEGLTKRFMKKTVVDDLCIEIKDGEFVCLLGPQGAGKTTTLRMIAGLEKPTSGRIYFGEEDMTDASPGERNVAMVFQTFALYPQRTVYENLEFTLKKDRMSNEEMKNRVKEIAEMLKITHLLDKRPVFLSGGEKQRVSLGRALVRKPTVFLFDEPLTNLDAKLRLHMRSELKRIQKELGQTAIFSTADDIEAITMSDKIAVINEGRLQQYDEVYNVYDHPKNIFTGKFVGTPPINLIDCKLTQDAGRILLDLKGQTYDISDFKDVLSERVSSDVVLGIRPSDITVSREKIVDGLLSASVYEMILTGDIYELALDISGNVVRSLVPSSFQASIGDEFWVSLDQSRLHLFDKQTGDSLL